MTSAPSPPAAIPPGSVCALHPERPATVTCVRCGRFICLKDAYRSERRLFCPTCFERPEVAYLETLRPRAWGKRDGWAYLVGLVGLVSMLSGLGGVVTSERTVASVAPDAFWAAYGVAGVCFFLRMRWARVALLVLPWGPVVVPGAIVLLASLSGAAHPAGELVADARHWLTVAVFAMPVPFLLAVAIFFDTRNRFFFRIDVSADALRRSWFRPTRNDAALNGLRLSLVSLVIPPLALVSALVCIDGLTRVNPQASPPVEGRRQALAGLSISGLSVLFWLAIFLAARRHS